VNLGQEILVVLNDPTRMWEHAIAALSPDARQLFITKTLLPERVSLEDLNEAAKVPSRLGLESLTASLQALEDSFLSVLVPADGSSDRYISFRNPSLEDFAYAYIDRNTEHLSTTVAEAIYFEQISTVVRLSNALSRDGGGLRHTGVVAWVTRHRALVLERLVALLSSQVPSQIFSWERGGGEREQFVLDCSLRWGTPLSSANRALMKERLQSLNSRLDRVWVDWSIELLSPIRRRELVDSIIGRSTLDDLRDNLICRQYSAGDGWHFTRLAEIDRISERTSAETKVDWGADAIDYCRNLAWLLRESEDGDEIADAIREIEELSQFLDEDLEQERFDLESRRESLPSEPDDEEYEQRSSPEAAEDSWEAVDELFETLVGDEL